MQKICSAKVYPEIWRASELYSVHARTLNFKPCATRGDASVHC
jgi:hypothetical protein